MRSFILIKCLPPYIIDSVSIDNEYDYENEILPLTIMRMRFAQNTCSTRSTTRFPPKLEVRGTSF